MIVFSFYILYKVGLGLGRILEVGLLRKFWVYFSLFDIIF